MISHGDEDDGLQTLTKAEGTVKWYSRRQAYGFITCAANDILKAAEAKSVSCKSLEAASSAGASTVDVWFGRRQAEDGPGIEALSRCALVGINVLYRREQDRLEASDIKLLPANAAARQLADSGGARGVAPPAVDAKQAMQALAAEVSIGQARRLADVDLFPHSLKEFAELISRAWQDLPAAGRDAWENFIQAACFDALQGFERHVLLSPAFGAKFGSQGAKDAASMLEAMSRQPWCWTASQRRVLEDWASSVLQLHSTSGPMLDTPPSQVPLQEADNSSMVEEVLRSRTDHFVVVLEGVRNSANQLMIFRTCEALGVQGVWMVAPPATEKYRKVPARSKRSSRRCERFLSLRHFADAAELLQACRSEGRELWVSCCPSGPDDTSVHPLTLQPNRWPAGLPRLAMVLGSEGDGVSQDLQSMANQKVYLPLHGFVQSLNVSVACGMLLQRLFDLCPQARGDLPEGVRCQLRPQLASAARIERKSKLGADEAMEDDDLDSG